METTMPKEGTMAEKTEQKITEWASDKLSPKMVFVREDEVYDRDVYVQCTEANETALHVTDGTVDGPDASLYMTPSEAYLLAERLRTAAWIAEQLGAPDAA